MKRSTKGLSVLLAFVMLITSLTIGFYGAAEEINLSEKYDELAELMSNSYVRNLNNYTSVSETDEEDYVLDGGYRVTTTVLAKDNEDRDIYNAAAKFFEIVDLIKSTTHGVGYYSSIMIANEIKEELSYRMDDTIVVMEPRIVEVPVERQVEVETEDPNNPGETIIVIETRTFMEKVTEYEPVTYERYMYYNVSAIVTNFIGGQLSLNASNWFCYYVFEVETDLETVLLSYETLIDLPNNIPVYKNTYRWLHARESFDMGTNYQYVLDSIEEESDSYIETETQINLKNADNVLGPELFFEDYSSYTPQMLEDIRAIYKPFVDDMYKHSDELLVHFFPDKLYNLMHWFYSIDAIVDYPLVREVRDGITYTAGIEELNETVEKIDNLLTSEPLGAVLTSFIDTSDAKYADSPIYGAEFQDAQELIKLFVQDFLFRDSLVTSLFTLLYPLLDEEIGNINDEIPIINLFNTFEGENIYIRFNSVRSRMNAYPDVVNFMNQAGSWQALVEMENLEEMSWGIDNSANPRNAFLQAIYAAFRPIEPLLPIIFCDRQNVGLAGGIVELDGTAGYRNLILPLFETLGITGMATWDQYRTGQTCESILGGIFNPLINWLLTDVASSPITVISNLLPNFSLFLSKSGSKSPMQAAMDTLKFDITTSGGVINAYTLDVGEMLDDFYPHLGSGIAGIFGIIDSEDLSAIPPILDNVVQAAGTKVTAVSPYSGVSRDYIRVYYDADGDPSNGVDIDKRGNILLWLLRFVFTALNYRTYNNLTNEWEGEGLLGLFGLDLEEVDLDLADSLGLDANSGLGVVSSIIASLAIHPDEAVLAILELIIPNETGQYPSNGTYESSPYLYNMQELTYTPEIVEYGSFGMKPQYSEMWTKDKATYVGAAMGPLVERLLTILKIDGFENLQLFIQEFLAENIFTQDMLTSLASSIYPMIAELGVDSIFSALLGLDYTPKTVAQRMSYLNAQKGRPASEVQQALEYTSQSAWETDSQYSDVYNVWSEDLLYPCEYQFYLETVIVVDPNTGETSTELVMNHKRVRTSDVPLDWGFEDGDREAWLDNLVALLSPFADVLQLIFADRDLVVLDLINISGYAGYQYAIIPLLEALGCDNVKTYAQYKNAINETTNPLSAEINTFYYILNPLLSLFDKLVADPITTLIEIVPNLIYFLSIGGLNIILNNLVHFLYVLIDILNPIIDVYPLVNSLLGGLKVGDASLGLSLPLNLNLTQLVDNVLAGLLNEGIDIGGSEVKLKLKIPQFDLSMLVAGTPVFYEDSKWNSTSRTLRQEVIYIEGDGGADLVTVFLTFILDILFYSENKLAIGDYLTGYFELDEEDESTARGVLDYFANYIEENQVDQQILSGIHSIISMIYPYTADLAEMFENSEIGLIDLFGELPNVFEGDTSGFMAMIAELQGGVPNPTISGFQKIIQAIMDFFAKIQLFFANLFS